MAVFLGNTNPFPGAGWTRIEALADVWMQCKHELMILGTLSISTFSKKKKSRTKYRIYNSVIRIGLMHPLAFILNFSISFFSCVLLFFALKPDILIVSLPTGDSGLGAMIACQILGIKYIVDYRDEWEDRTIGSAKTQSTKLFYEVMKYPAAKLYSKASLIVTVTTRFRRALLKRGLKSIIIPNGADTMVFKPKGKSSTSDQIFLVYSGILGDCYAFDNLLQSIKYMDKEYVSRLKLIIAGTGNIERIFEMASKLDLLHNIQYLGTIQNRSEIAQIIRNSDIGLIPFDDNPLLLNVIPVKFYEYCACGLPIMAFALKGSLLEKLVRENNLGEVVEPGNTIEFARALERLIMNKQERLECGKRGVELIRTRFERRNNARKYLKYIEQIIIHK